jgi:hypothetical protein
MKLEIFLLQLYPREWRARYEDEFMALLEQTHSTPLDIADVVLGALDAHLRPQVTAASVGVERRLFMNRATFIQWSGMAAMTGSVLMFIGIGWQLIYSILDELADAVVWLAGVVLMLIGVVGFGLAYARRTGGLGQGGLLLALIGTSALTLGSVGAVLDKVGNDLPDNGVLSWPAMLFFGQVGMCAGMALFAIAGLRQRVLAIPAALLLLVGGTCSAIGLIIFGMVFLMVSDDSDVAVTASRLGWVIGGMLFLVGFFLAGSALWSGRGLAVRPAEPTSVGL